MSTVDQILMWLLVFASFLGGISVGIFIVVCWKGLRDELNEIAEREENNER